MLQATTTCTPNRQQTQQVPPSNPPTLQPKNATEHKHTLTTHPPTPVPPPIPLPTSPTLVPQEHTTRHNLNTCKTTHTHTHTHTHRYQTINHTISEAVLSPAPSPWQLPLDLLLHEPACICKTNYNNCRTHTNHILDTIYF